MGACDPELPFCLLVTYAGSRLGLHYLHLSKPRPAGCAWACAPSADESHIAGKHQA
jgi:hypothetical protein